MSASHRFPIQDLHSGQFVEAILTERIDVMYAKRADDAWLTFLATAKALALAAGAHFDPPEHMHWRWERKVLASAHLLSYPTMGIEYEGQVQGLMMLLTDGEFGRLPEQARQPLVYVHFLATAPWNLGAVVAQPRFRGVGTVLLRAAIETSIDLGFKGRMGLHSLPQSETWYDRIGMICLGADSSKQNLKYYEMTAAQAAVFVR